MNDQYLPINKVARDKIIKRNESSKRLAIIMKGLEQEKDKKEQLAANLLFSSPLEKYSEKDVQSIKDISILKPDKKNYEKALGILDHKNMSSGIHMALDNVYEYDSELKRCENGSMNLATIMTEYRRKQLMDALLFENECDDPYEGRDKLKIFLATKHPELLENENNIELVHKDKLLTIKLDTKKLKKKANIVHNNNNNKFIPKWGSYDTMKNRWQYIRPQLKQLTHAEDMYAPIDANKSYILKDGMKINSNYQDAVTWTQRSYKKGDFNLNSTISSSKITRR